MKSIKKKNKRIKRKRKRKRKRERKRKRKRKRKRSIQEKKMIFIKNQQLLLNIIIIKENIQIQEKSILLKIREIKLIY